MRGSKLEAYIDILNVLSLNGQLSITDIMDKSNIEGKVMIEELDFLINCSLVEEKVIGKERLAFTITAKGITVLRFFGKIDNIVSVEEKKRMLLS